NILSSTTKDLYLEYYNGILYKVFLRGRKEDFVKDILNDVIDITKKCFKYYKQNPNRDICLPFYSELEKISKNGKPYSRKYIVNTILNRQLPKVPVVILDATGDKELFEQLFGREVVEYSPKLKIKRNVIQICDGMYYSASMFYDSTRNRIYNAVYRLIKYHLKKDTKNINIVTMKKYSTIANEEGKYKNMSIERYLINKGLDMSRIIIWHYGAVKGKNAMQDDNVLILIGTPEPNIYSFPKEVECWYEGQKKIVTDRIPEPSGSPFHEHNYRYADKRYYAHVRSKREHELEQDIERLRFAISNKGKVVYVFSMLPLSIDTKRINLKDLEIELHFEGQKALYSVLKVLYEGRGKVSYQKISDKTRYLKCVKNQGGTSKVIQDALEKQIIEQVEKGKARVYKFTELGKILFMDIYRR
ncbi:MAG: hypothetical protein KAS76_04785, partial [Thermoplasmatales archaeon]|nr:hypothetical protein [Thermoplasmatales archaeon]